MSYKTTSSTTTYRTHLSTAHPNSWVEACDHLGIPISGKNFQPLVEKIRKQLANASRNAPVSGTDAEANAAPRIPFSTEAFLDAIIDFVVADDQV